eukprot:jgi/Undpi1/3236/HiC_scaffold_15.g06610.m1
MSGIFMPPNSGVTSITQFAFAFFTATCSLLFQAGEHFGHDMVALGFMVVIHDGLVAVQWSVLPYSAIGRIVPVSAVPTKLEASPEKTVIADTALYDDVTDEFGEGDKNGIIKTFEIHAYTDSGRPSQDGVDDMSSTQAVS